MWVIFIATCLFLITLGLFIWWIAAKIYISIRRKEKQFELEETGYESTKKILKESIEKEREYNER